MLSKCLNPSCHAKFRTLEHGRLFLIDFREVQQLSAHTGRKFVAPVRSKEHPVEHFWLCERCAATTTVRLGSHGELELLPIPAQPKPVAEKLPLQRSASAS
jgi:hypothetical protein